VAAQSVGHWHHDAFEEQHCQLCHFGQISVPRPAIAADMQAPTLIASFAPAEHSTLVAEAVRTLSIPRGPPVHIRAR
jgi:hypothetical protein